LEDFVFGLHHWPVLEGRGGAHLCPAALVELAEGKDDRARMAKRLRPQAIGIKITLKLVNHRPNESK
jgi:hypothetical protein